MIHPATSSTPEKNTFTCGDIINCIALPLSNNVAILDGAFLVVDIFINW
jgi:hypothetical protein